MPSAAHDREPFQPVAAAIALVLPGAGHWYLGHAARAARIAAGVLGLFFFGLLVGGISCVDRRENFIWFMGQALTGPVAFATDIVHERMFKVIDPVSSAAVGVPVVRSARPNEYRNPANAAPVPISLAADGTTWATLPDGSRVSPAYPPYIKGVGRMNELGTLFTTIAGFMNLICVIDAAFLRRRDAAGPPRAVGRL